MTFIRKAKGGESGIAEAGKGESSARRTACESKSPKQLKKASPPPYSARSAACFRPQRAGHPSSSQPPGTAMAGKSDGAQTGGRSREPGLKWGCEAEGKGGCGREGGWAIWKDAEAEGRV